MKKKRKARVGNMILLDGKKIKQKILEDLKIKLLELNEKLGLAVIQVGDDPASNVYVRQKGKMAEELGYNFNYIKLEENVNEDEILAIIDKLNNDDMVDGILMQLPIPRRFNVKKIQNAILPYKYVN